MEVNNISFPGRLLEMLEAISNSLFVSFDLEFSGVSSKLAASKGKQSIQERYEEVKEAAERYQILQIGLTCVHLDADRNRYVVRPYNFNLSPLMEEKLDIERIFSFQSGAAEFLLGHGFDIGQPFKHGVPYLSRDEARLAKKIAVDKLDKSNYEDIQLEVGETESLEFLKRVRQAIGKWETKWIRNGKLSSAFLNITSLDPTKDNQSGMPELGRFEKRLVHQLVRTEYPSLVTISRGNGVRIIPYDEAREKLIRSTKKEKIKQQITKQTGFRWMVEALCGGNLNAIDVRSFAHSPITGEHIFVDLDDLTARFDRVKDRLKTWRPVLVGHNLFTDLIYFYRTFIGPLPATVVEFQHVVHELFPLVVDTKYMATHNCGDISPASSLDQIEAQLRLQRSPWVETHPAHDKYTTTSASLHEAGYDSYLTALIMVRLSAKLASTKEYLADPANASSDDEYATAPEDALGGGVSLTLAASLDSSAQIQSHGSSETAAAGLEETPKKKRKKQKKKGPADDVPKSIFAHNNIFSHLREALPDPDLESSLLQSTGRPAAESQPTVNAATDAGMPSNDRSFKDDSTGIRPLAYPQDGSEPGRVPINKDPMAYMPPFTSSFWRVYGNKLRVFGTVEAVCKLG